MHPRGCNIVEFRGLISGLRARLLTQRKRLRPACGARQKAGLDGDVFVSPEKCGREKMMMAGNDGANEG